MKGVACGISRAAIVAGIAAATALAAALVVVPSRPQLAQAASCSTESATFAAGALDVRGQGACADESESFRPFCDTGSVKIEYGFTDGTLGGTYAPGVDCGSVQTMIVEGLGGDDKVDLSGATPAGGFHGLGTPLVFGGDGNDLITSRNNSADQVDCGPGLDAVQADRPSLDMVVNCEVTDIAPEPAPATKRKCKKKHKHHRAAAPKKCKRRAVGIRR